MRIISNEMKKIWNLKMLLVVVVLCYMFYKIFMSYSIEYFPNGHSDIEEIEYSKQLTQLYGPKLEADEYAEFMAATRQELISEAETYITSMPIFAEAGIHTYDDYEKVNENRNQTELETAAIWTLFGEDGDFVRFKLQALDRIEERYNNYPEYALERLSSIATSGLRHARFMEIKETEEYRNIMDGYVFENTETYTLYLAILAVLAVLVFVSPILVTDRARSVHLLQYAAKNGRTILKQQLIAVLLSAFLLTTALILVFGAIYSTNDTWAFWNSGLTSFLNINTEALWFDITYGQYVCLSIGLIYILGLGAAAITFTLSRFSRNPITLILKLIPLFAGLAFLCLFVFMKTFDLTIKDIVGIEPIGCGLVLMTGLAVSIYTLRRERRIDVS